MERIHNTDLTVEDIGTLVEAVAIAASRSAKADIDAACCNTPPDHAKSRRLRIELETLKDDVVAEIERRITARS